MELNQNQIDKIARDLGEGFTSGRFTADGLICAWELKADIWDEMACTHFQCHERRYEDNHTCYAHTFCDCPKVSGKYHAHYMPECPNRKQ
jgi:hypothetical protein